MRLVFLGSDAFAVPTLNALVARDHDVALVYTQPDRAAGRGRHAESTPVKRAAEALGFPVVQPESLRDGRALAHLDAAAPDLAVVVAYGHLIPPAMLASPAHGFINAHASLLPKYRGAAPVPHAILNHEAETGVTVFRLNERFDAGAILGRAAIPIAPDETAGGLLARLAPLAATLVLEVIGQIQAGWAQPLPQAEAEATRAPKLAKDMGRIDWSAPRREIDARVRAFQPWPLAYTFFPAKRGPQRVTILKVSPAAGAPGISAAPGTVIAADARSGITIQAGDGPLHLACIRPAGKRDMDSAEYMRGARLAAGETLA